MSDIQGQIVLAENSAGNGLQRLKLNSGGLLRVVAEATSVSANQIDLNTDGLEGLLATIDGVLDNSLVKQTAIASDIVNAEAHLGNIDTGIDVLEACVGSNKVNVNISSGNITGFATASNQATIIGHVDGVETSLTAITGYVDGLETLQTATNSALGTIDGVLDNSLVKQTAMATDLAALEVLQTATNSALTTIDGVLDNAEAHLGNIDTGIDVLEACVGSNKVNVNISSGNISGFSTASNQSTIIGHIDGVETLIGTTNSALGTIDGVLDNSLVKQTAMATDLAALEVLQTATNSALATIDGVLDNAEAHLGNIDTGVDVLEACVGSNKVNVNISSGNISGFSTASNQSTIIGHIDGVETLIGTTNSTLSTMDGVLDNSLVKQTAIATDIAALEVLHTATNQKLDDIETAVQLIDDAIKTEDLAHSSGDKGIPCLMVRQDSHSDLAADGDYMIPTINANGEIRVTSTAASGGSTEAKQDDVIGHLDGVEGKLDHLSDNLDTLETTLTAIETDIAANEVLHSAANALLTTIDADTGAIKTDIAANEVLLTGIDQKLGDIETAVQAVQGAMTVSTILSGSVSAGSTGTSTTFTKPREVDKFAFAVVAATNGSYNAFVEASVDNTTFFSMNGGQSFNTGGNAENFQDIGTSQVSSAFKFYRVVIANNHSSNQNFVVKVCS